MSKLGRKLMRAQQQRRPGGVGALPREAFARINALRTRLVDGEARLRALCTSFNYGGDKAACLNDADQVRRFLVDSLPKATAAADAGDLNRFNAMVAAGGRILASVVGDANDFGRGLMITEELGKTVVEFEGALKKTAAVGTGALIAVGVALVGAKVAGVL